MNKRDNNERIDASLPVKQLYSSLNSHSGYFDFTLHLYIFMIVLRQAVQRLAFLGVTGFWDASVMLAHQMLGPHVPIDADEFEAENTGPLTDQLAAATAESLAAVPTAQQPKSNSNANANANTVVAQQHRYSACDATPATGNNAMASLCADPFDEDLFRLAKIRFVQDVMRHHTTPVTFAADYRAGPPAAVTNF
jgi:hypothetical protein